MASVLLAIAENLFMVNLHYSSLNLSWQNRFNMCCILCLCFISLLSLKFVKLWFISAWFTPKVAAGRRICWRKKRSTLFKNGTDSSFSNISDSSIIATVTLHELPCCFSLFMKLCRRSLIFGLIIADGLNDMFGWIFNNMYKKCPKFASFAQETGHLHQAVSRENPAKQCHCRERPYDCKFNCTQRLVFILCTK